MHHGSSPELLHTQGLSCIVHNLYFSPEFTLQKACYGLLQAFDDLLLLKVGGQVTYHGHLGKRSRTLIRYFEAIPGVPRCREGLNPATWMLQISTPAMEQRIGVNFADHYAASSAQRYILANLNALLPSCGG